MEAKGHLHFIVLRAPRQLSSAESWSLLSSDPEKGLLYIKELNKYLLNG